MNIEPLEARIAPASLVYLDSDGDRVTITTSGSGALTVGASVILSSGNSNVPGQLQALFLTDPAFNGASVKLAVQKAEGGDGRANVGLLDATNNDLGTVIIPGDLGRILCGDTVTEADPGLGKLKVRSIGAFGITTQQPGGVLTSVITGAIGRLEIAPDFIEASLETTGDDALIRSLFIGGDVIGGSTTESGYIEADDGVITATILGKIIGGAGLRSGFVDCGDISGLVTIGGIVGGTGARSGFLTGSEGAVVVNGSILGGNGSNSGGIESEGSVGTVKVTGAVIGGGGVDSGRLDLDDTTSVSVGALIGGAGNDSGQVTMDTGGLLVRGNVSGGFIESSDTMHSLRIGGSVIGGRISAQELGSVSIGGSMIGGTGISANNVVSLRVGGNITGTGDSSADGRILVAGNLGKVFVGGSLVGGPAPDSGRFEVSGNVTEYIIRGSVIGGGGAFSGTLSGSEVGKVSIGGSVVGGTGLASGSLIIGSFASLTIRHSLVGGDGDSSGSYFGAGGGAVTIGGDLLGGDGPGSGRLAGSVAMGNITIKGSLVGGNAESTGEIQGGSGLGDIFIGGTVRGTGFGDTGKISTNFMGSVFIGGDLIGGDFAPDVPRADSGLISAGSIEAVKIRGNLVAGSNAPTVQVEGSSGAILANSIGPIAIGGSIIGSATNRALITAVSGAGGNKPETGFDTAIASITVKGDVLFADILAGFSGFLRTPANADASIGPVIIGGDWRASNLVAGAQDAGATGFGAGDILQAIEDTPLIARIARLSIAGAVSGTGLVPGDHFGIVTQQLDALSIDGRIIPLSPNPAINDNFLLSLTGDIRALEVG